MDDLHAAISPVLYRRDHNTRRVLAFNISVLS